jgi:GNAT superfamily N-acetyltransferase
MARPEDFDECVEILPEEWQISPMKARLGYLLMSRNAIIAMDDNGKVDGFVELEIDFFDNNTVYLRTGVVRPEKRNQGIGTALLDSAIAYARGLGARRIFTDVIGETDFEIIGVRDATITGLNNRGFEVAGYIENMHDESDARYEVYSLPIHYERESEV